MFFRKAPKSSRSSVAAESTQEPSSPKVTCMGQVRVGRSKKPQTRKPGREVDDDSPGSSSWCPWISRYLLCNRPAGGWRRRRRSKGSGQLRCMSLSLAWPDCSSFCHVAGRRRRRPKISKEDSPSSKEETELKFRNSSLNSKFRGHDSELKSKEEEDDEDGARASIASSSNCSPPKNALILTRCRSAPYRSSSLACRFWGSPLNGDREAQRPPQNVEESAGEEPKPLLGSEGESRGHPDEDEEEEEEEKERFLKEITGSVAEKMVKPSKIEELKSGEEEGLRQQPRLARCKSEPARTSAQKVGFR